MKYKLIPAIIILFSGCAANDNANDNEYKKSMDIVFNLLAHTHDYRHTSFCDDKYLTLVLLKDSLIASVIDSESNVYGHRSEIYYQKGQLVGLRTVKAKIEPSATNIEIFNEIHTIDTTASFYFDSLNAKMPYKDFLQLIDGCAFN